MSATCKCGAPIEPPARFCANCLAENKRQRDAMRHRKKCVVDNCRTFTTARGKDDKPLCKRHGGEPPRERVCTKCAMVFTLQAEERSRVCPDCRTPQAAPPTSRWAGCPPYSGCAMSAPGPGWAQ